MRGGSRNPAAAKPPEEATGPGPTFWGPAHSCSVHAVNGTGATARPA
jgi:hypothetical protein